MNPAIATPRQGQLDAVLQGALRDVYGREASLEHWTATPLAEREKRRIVRYDLKVCLPGSTKPLQHQWVGKFYDTEDIGPRVATVLHSLASTDCSAHGKALFPTPITWHPPLRLLLLSYQEGESVISALAGGNKAIPAAIARALAALHSAPVHVDAFSSTSALLEDLERRLHDLGTWLSLEPSLLRDTLHRLQSHEPPAPSRSAFLHGDFGPAQLLWQADRLVILDFDKCTRGDAAQDLGNLLIQLRRCVLLKKQGIELDFPSLRRSILDAYQQWSPADLHLPKRIPWYEKVTLIRKLHFLYRSTEVHKRTEAILLLKELPNVIDSL